MLGQRRRRWPNIKPALIQSVVFTGIGCTLLIRPVFSEHYQMSVCEKYPALRCIIYNFYNLDGEDRKICKILRSQIIQTGNCKILISTNSQRYKYSMVPSPSCERCGTSKEDPYHSFFVCPALCCHSSIIDPSSEQNKFF